MELLHIKKGRVGYLKQIFGPASLSQYANFTTAVRDLVKPPVFALAMVLC